MDMSPPEKSAYFACLYLTLGVLAAVNAASIFQGYFVAVWPLLIQLAVISWAATRQPWAHVIVMAWSATCVVSALAMWLAAVLRESFSNPIGIVVYKTILMAICLYLLLNAPDAFKRAPLESSGSEA
jgi:hypothetical protein